MLVFPSPLRFLVGRPWLAHVIDAPSFLCGLLFAGVYPDHEQAVRVLFRISGALSFAGVLAALAVLVWRLRRAAPGPDAAKLRALIVAGAIGLPAPALYTLVLAFRWWIPESEVPGAAAAVACAAMPIIVGVGVVRGNLFDRDAALARAAAYSGLVAMLAGTYVVAAVVLPQLVAPDRLLGTPAGVALAIGVAGVALWPVRTRAQRWLEDWFHGDATREQLVDARTFIAGIAAPTAASCGRLERRLEAALRVANASVLIRDEDRWMRPATDDVVRVDRLALVEWRDGERILGAFGLPQRKFRPDVRLLLEQLADDAARTLRSQSAGSRIGEYQIERLIATGGMGSVYRATRTGAGGFAKPVAIKVLLPKLIGDGAAVDRFLKEARLVARLSHPNLVQVFELGEHEGTYFIAMELVDGIDTSALIRARRRKLPLAFAAHVATGACLGLEHAHRAVGDDDRPLGLIHHDVSPHNLLIDRAGTVKLTDFGVAAVAADRTRSQLAGKLGYHAPEQLRGDPVDHRIDVFATAIVLYELVTGHHPFRQPRDEATCASIVAGRYLPPETLREDCPPALSAAIARGLATDPAERFASAGAMAAALEAVYPPSSRAAGDLGAMIGTLTHLDAAPPERATATLPIRR